ncbi:hypothetical protein D3C73_1119870 [compost metagenome]
MCPFLNAADVAGRLWLPGANSRLHDGADGAGIYSGEIDGDAGSASSWLPHHAGRRHGIYRPDDCAVLFAISRDASLDVDPAAVHFRYGNVHPVYFNEYHYPCGSNR